MNVTLIRPPAYSAGLMGAQLVPFLGIAYIGAAARKAGQSVDIIDMCGEDIGRTQIVRDRYVAYGMPFEVLKERLKPSSVVGFTSMFSQDWVFHKALIRFVRSICPDALFVAGGEHISAAPEFSLEDCPELDVAVIGEGEDAFVKLLGAVEKKGDYASVPSLVYRGENGGYIHTQRAARIRDIDSLPMPAWDLTPMENYLSRNLNYHIERGRTIPMLASRGCPYACSFCSNYNMWGAPWIARDPKLVAQEMEYYITRYSADNFVFSDLTAIVDKQNIVKLCDEIRRRNLRITWQLPTIRTEAVDKILLRRMHEAGCRDLDFAIESGSRKVLISVNKRSDPNRIFSLVEDSLTVGMNLSSNIVIGLPQETLGDFLKTYALVMKLALKGMQELNVFPFVPYPGSRLFEEYRETRKVRLNDGYFLGLFGYADIARAISYSPHFGPRSLGFMRFMLLASFYGLMFISHPGRVVHIIINAVRGRTTTKLEGVLRRVFRNVRVYVNTDTHR